MFTLSLLTLVAFTLFVLISLARDSAILLVTVNVVAPAIVLKGDCEGKGRPARGLLRPPRQEAGRAACPGVAAAQRREAVTLGGVATEASEVVVRDMARKRGEKRKRS